MREFINKHNLWLPMLTGIALFMCFWRLGNDPLHQWDESRNGVNAIEMLQNHDYVNLYYGGKPDTWNAKPPLMIWMIAASYNVFGFTEFALRFPAALAIFCSLLVLYAIIRLYGSSRLAFLTCIIVMTVNGIIGSHVGRTGDFDALFIMFLLLTLYFTLKYVDFNDKSAILLAGVSLGLAFYTKGLASIIIVPGIVLYLLLSNKLLLTLKDYRAWLSVFIYLGFVLSWFLIINQYGISFKESIYGSENTVETMWKYDVLQRLTMGISSGHQKNYAFFFNYLDARFNVWNYIFYLAVAFALIQLSGKIKLPGYPAESNPLVKLALISFCIWITIGTFLTLSIENHNWYLAPALPFIAITTTIGIRFFIERYHYAYLLLIALIIFTFARKVVDLGTSDVYPLLLSANAASIESAESILCVNVYRQDYLCYMKMNKEHVESVELTTSDLGPITGKNKLLLLETAIYVKIKGLYSNLKVIGTDDKYSLVEFE